MMSLLSGVPALRTSALSPRPGHYSLDRIRLSRISNCRALVIQWILSLWPELAFCGFEFDLTNEPILLPVAPHSKVANFHLRPISIAALLGKNYSIVLGRPRFFGCGPAWLKKQPRPTVLEDSDSSVLPCDTSRSAALLQAE